MSYGSQAFPGTPDWSVMDPGLFRILVESNADGILVVDESGSIRYANAMAATLLGRPTQSLAGAPLGLPVNPERTEEIDLRQPSGATITVEFRAEETLGMGVRGWIVTLRDTSERRRIQLAQAFLLRCGWKAQGQDFFQSLATWLARTLKAKSVLIGIILPTEGMIETVVHLEQGRFLPTRKLDLRGGPCGGFASGAVCCVPQQLRSRYPNQLRYRELEAESLAGIVLEDEEGKKVGILEVLSDQPLDHPAFVDELLQLVAMRASSELQRHVSIRKVKEAYAFLQGLVEHAPVGILVYDGRTGACETANPAAGEIVGARREDLLAQNFRQIASWATSGLLAAAEEALAWGGPVRIVRKVKSTFGRTVWLSSILSGIGAGTDRKLLLLAMDVTEPREARARLQELSDRLLLATKAARVGIWDWDVAANSLVWDEVMCSLYGIAPDAFSGTFAAWSSAVHPEDLPAAQAALDRALQGGDDFASEFRVIRGDDGSVCHMRANGIIHRDDLGLPVRMVGANWDVTLDRKRDLDQQELIQQLSQTLADVRTLQELLPICSHCKRIRDDQGYWNQLESYISEHSGTTFTHGLCPECIPIYFPQSSRARKDP